jgi:hypothetical protein
MLSTFQVSPQKDTFPLSLSPSILIVMSIPSYCDEYPFILWWVSLHIVVSIPSYGEDTSYGEEYPFL